MIGQKSVLLLVGFSMLSCTNTSELKSIAIDDKAKRIAILENEVNFFSSVTDAEFDLFNVNGFSGDVVLIPGASSSLYRFVVKVNPHEVKKWEDGLVDTIIAPDNQKWMLELVSHRKENWKVDSKPKFFTRKHSRKTVIAIFEKEGIVYKCIDAQ